MPAAGQCDEYRAHRLLGRATAGTGDSGDRQGVICAQSVSGADRHLAGGGLADSALEIEGIPFDTEQEFFGGIAVGNAPAEEHGRSPWHIGNPVGNEPARAGLGDNQRLFSLREEGHHDLFELSVAVAENVFTQQPLNASLRLVDHPFRFGPARVKSHVHLAGARTIAKFQPGLSQLSQRSIDAFLDLGFTDAYGAQDPARKGGTQRAELLEPRQNVRIEHGPEFTRWSREHHEPGGAGVGTERIAIDGKEQARRRAVGIGQDHGALRHEGLHGRARRHGTVASGEERGQFGEDGGILAKRSTQQASDLFPGEVIGRGSQSARGDNPIGASQGFGDRLFDDGGVIRNGYLALNGIAGIGQLAADPLLMSIENPPEQEFAAGGDELDDHVANVIVERARFQAEKLRRDTRGLRSKLAWSGLRRVVNCGPMKVDLGIWDRLSRLIVLLLIVAAVLGVALWYLPVIQQNERMRKEILILEDKIDRELQRNRELSAEVESYRDPRMVERLARERLNYARPDEIVIRFEDPTPTNVSSIHR